MLSSSSSSCSSSGSDSDHERVLTDADNDSGADDCDSNPDSSSDVDADTDAVLFQIDTTGTSQDPLMSLHSALHDPIFTPDPAKPEIQRCIVCLRKTLKTEKAATVHLASKVHGKRIQELRAHAEKLGLLASASVWDALATFPPHVKRVKLNEKVAQHRERRREAKTTPGPKRKRRVRSGEKKVAELEGEKLPRKRKRDEADADAPAPKKKRKSEAPKRRAPRIERLERQGRDPRTVMKGKGKHAAKQNETREERRARKMRKRGTGKLPPRDKPNAAPLEIFD
ncbi:hypothetical protein MKEN_00377900 [Mycena kentingensis (nom. inval.)]|nr:hypothetical protein MKEN_00377900 [Mycena kentingensis (nom. inval.)]